MSSPGNTSTAYTHNVDQVNVDKRMELLEMSQAVNRLGSWEWDLKKNKLFWTDEMFTIRATPVTVNNEISFEDNYNFIHPDDRALFMEKLDLLKQRNDVNFTYRIITTEGETRTVMAWATMLRDENGEPVCMRGTSLDITKQREMENQLLELNEALLQKNEELQRSNKELVSFSYVASHDLQAPLRQIRTFTSRLLEIEADNISQTGRDYLSRIENAATRMQTLIDDLLSWSKTDTSEKTFQLCDLNEILEEVKNTLRSFIEEQGATIEASNLPTVKVIPFQFKQMLENLLINSIKYSKPDVAPHILITSEQVKGSEIEAKEGQVKEAQADKTYHKFSISDNGIGFDPQYTERIFELFQRLHDKHEYPGTGLGLAICKKVIENHKGFIAASASPGSGATFTVYLPVL
jgi:signal transduction histidine kinase